MTRIYAAYDGGVAIIRHQEERWHAALTLHDRACQCLAVDPQRPATVYCGTMDAGLWRSDDGGDIWQPTETALPHQRVMSVAVSPFATGTGRSILWAGTEPSALFRSTDGGASWEECTGLQELPSKATWRFPPRPWTHHVRWIEPDRAVADRIYAGIELGGVMRSLDGGLTWEDRKPGSEHDCHTLRTHPAAPGLVYEAAGGGFAESDDGGTTWRGANQGLHEHYLWGLAVDSADPHTIIVSASPGPRAAHNDEHATSQLYRRSKDSSWELLHRGLPGAAGTRAYVLAASPTAGGIFYAATRQELYSSTDGGSSWRRLEIEWPGDVQFRTVNALVVAE